MAKTGPDTPDDERPDDDRVLHIHFRAGDSERIEEALETLDSGETPDPYVERVYHDPDELHRITRPKNLELLRTIVRERPASIRETARLVERDVRQVHRNLAELEGLGLLEFEDTDRAKRPRVWYDEITVELPLGADEGRDTDTAEA